MTPDEAFDIANALDFYIQHQIESSMLTVESIVAYTIPTEIEILQHFVGYSSYKLCAPNCDGNYSQTNYDNVDDYIKALAKNRLVSSEVVKPEKDL